MRSGLEGCVGAKAMHGNRRSLNWPLGNPRAFSHPDFTVGTGISPVRAHLNPGALAGCNRRSGIGGPHSPTSPNPEGFAIEMIVSNYTGVKCGRQNAETAWSVLTQTMSRMIWTIG